MIKVWKWQAVSSWKPIHFLLLFKLKSMIPESKTKKQFIELILVFEVRVRKLMDNKDKEY